MVVRRSTHLFLDEIGVPYAAKDTCVDIKLAALFTSSIMSKLLARPNRKLFNAVAAEGLIIKKDWVTGVATKFFCYILGAWQNGPRSNISKTLATTTPTSTPDCVITLNFDAAQHASGGGISNIVHFESCGLKQSELTPRQGPI
ncbi:hypothetical protein L7F22_018892 [Adiantum nelumboides]|nr:hypothetical protein [Adiantum nelumboides]